MKTRIVPFALICGLALCACEEKKAPPPPKAEPKAKDSAKSLIVLSDQAWQTAPVALAAWEDGRIKMYVLQEGLRHRREHSALYLNGDYVPLECDGLHKEKICAFARLHQDQAIVTVVPRLIADLVQDSGTQPQPKEMWQDTRISVPSWKVGSAYLNLVRGARPPQATDLYSLQILQSPGQQDHEQIFHWQAHPLIVRF